MDAVWIHLRYTKMKNIYKTTLNILSKCAVNRPAVCCIIPKAGFMIIRGVIQMQRLRFIYGETETYSDGSWVLQPQKSQPSTDEKAPVSPLYRDNPYVAAWAGAAQISHHQGKAAERTNEKSIGLPPRNTNTTNNRSSNIK